MTARQWPCIRNFYIILQKSFRILGKIKSLFIANLYGGGKQNKQQGQKQCMRPLLQPKLIN